MSMGGPFNYVSARSVSASDIRRLLRIDSLEEFSASASGFTAEFEVALPSLHGVPADLRGVESFSVEGRLTPNAGAERVLVGVLEAFADDLEDEQGCTVEIFFEESESRQEEETAEIVSVVHQRGLTSVSFLPGASRIVSDRDYGKKIMQEVSLESGLPLRFEESEVGYFLRHSDSSGEFHVLRSKGNGLDPVSFQCSIDLESHEQEIELLRQVSERWGSGEVFSYLWTVFSEECADNNATNRLFQRVLAQKPKADVYALQLSVRVEGMDEMENLRSFIGAAEIVWPFGSFLLPDDNYANMEIGTSSRGHILRLECRYPVAVSRLGEMLGVEFVEAGAS